MNTISLFFNRYVNLLMLLMFASVHAPCLRAEPYSIPKLLKDKGYERDDIFVILKRDPSFAAICKEYGLDRPSSWPGLLNKLRLRQELLKERLEEASSMRNTSDMRSSIDGRRLSKADVRQDGQERYAKYSEEMAEVQLVEQFVLGLQDEMERVRRRDSLTGEVEIKNVEGKGFVGSVVLMDAGDAIIHKEGAGYFRVVLAGLSPETQMKIFECLVASWHEIPGWQENEPMGNLDDVIAYDDSYLYQKRGDSLVRLPFAENVMTYERRQFIFEVLLSNPSNSIGESKRFYLDQDALDYEIKGDGYRGYLVEMDGRAVFIKLYEREFLSPGWAEMNLISEGKSKPINLPDGSSPRFPIYGEVSSKTLKWHTKTLGLLETSKQRAEMNRRRCDLIKFFESLDGIELPVVEGVAGVAVTEEAE
ncbi:hypothetical protein [Cerasicoccus maritimus]|uniref:hypothetical protein n=1 Tax=Cerasicoccus maritimus TaxID=490089 RepID=UPI0028524BF0|nr:hypothetical protein [Cerasicoccus maritimus]